MKFNIIELIRSAFVKRDQKFRQRLTVFFICLLISIFVWFTVKMDNEYQEIIPIPVKFFNPPKSHVLVEASDSVIYVELNEKGSELLRYRYVGNSEPLEISVKNVILSQKTDGQTGYLLTSSLFDDLGYQHNMTGKIVSIAPDTIYLTFKEESTRKVPVSADLQLNTQQQFMVYGKITYQPDSVMIRGPKDIIGNISTVSLGTIEFQDLNKTVERIYPVPARVQQEHITVVPGEVMVTIPVEKFTELVLDVPISILADSSLHIKLFPDVASISCLVALKDYTQVTPGMFMVAADFRDVDIEKEKEVRVRVTEAPSAVKISRIDPEKVEFIIIK